MKKFFIALAACAALGIFFSPAPAAVHKAAPVSKKARIIKGRIAKPKSTHKKPRAKAMVHKKTRAKVATAEKKESLFWKIILNPVILCIVVPLLIALVDIAIQIRRRFPWRKLEKLPEIIAEDNDPRTWDRIFWDRVKDKTKNFLSRFRKESAAGTQA